MKTRLLYRDRDLTEPPRTGPEAERLRADLELDGVLRVMAGGDPVTGELCAAILLDGAGGRTTPADLRYRQAVVRDAIANPDVVAELRALADDALDAERRKVFGLFSRATPDKVLLRSLDVMEMYLGVFERLRALCAAHAQRFASDGFRSFFGTVAAELDDAYLAQVADRLAELRAPRGEVIAARLGPGNHGVDHVLRTPPRGGLRGRMHRDPHWLPIDIDPADQGAAEELAAVHGHGIVVAADALAQACEHVTRYLRTVSLETGFLLACARLHAELAGLGEPTCFPEVDGAAAPAGFAAADLRDPTLALRTGAATVGSAVDAAGRSSVVVTGANRGGKTTFLRAVGVAQLMLQAGMFVTAAEYRAAPYAGVFTHFTPDEDAAATRGRLDAELARMSAIADALRPGSLLLGNESFASTNERDGAAIAGAVLDACRDAGVSVVFVTHMFALADAQYSRGDPQTVFLRAERLDDGTRTYRQIEGRPLTTSFGDDLFRRVFGA